MIKKSDMEEVKVHRYPFEDDNDELEEEILNPTASIPDSYLRDSENCQITRWHTIPQKTKKFVEWIEETTNSKVEDIWGVWYHDGGGIKWHTHMSKDDIKYSFVYYVKVPEDSSSLRFSLDPSKSEEILLPVEQGLCAVWSNHLPHCVPPSNHKGRCVLSGNLMR